MQNTKVSGISETNKISIYLLYIVFFLSGVAALLFETLWFRQGGLVLGNTVWASSLILASFMCGLALGNGLAGKYGYKFQDPIKIYAIFEITVGITGFGLVLLFPILPGLLSTFFQVFLGKSLILNSLRLGISFFLLVVPTVAMGATLPIMVKGICRENISFGRALGILYACNTIGAFCGALIGELFLIERLGIRGTGLFAASVNLLAAAVALLVAKVILRARSDVRIREEKPVFSQAWLIKHNWSLLASAFIAGGILLALEVVWFRFMVLFAHASTYNFAVMLDQPSL